ncbi:hypothetical protein LXL04_024226 [Taraxacum kok-saghyz]
MRQRRWIELINDYDCEIIIMNIDISISKGEEVKICDLLHRVGSRLGNLASLVHQLAALLLKTAKQYPNNRDLSLALGLASFHFSALGVVHDCFFESGGSVSPRDEANETTGPVWAIGFMTSQMASPPEGGWCAILHSLLIFILAPRPIQSRSRRPTAHTKPIIHHHSTISKIFKARFLHTITLHIQITKTLHLTSMQ